jgi:prepilin-type processing-associated H-X9-DG protein
MTLLELLVVVAIIGILLALLIPSVGTAWDVALDTQCKCNLNRIFQAFGVFAAGGDTGRVLGESQFYPRVEYWPAVPYIVCDDARIFSCPQADAQPRDPGEDDPFDPAVFDPGGSGGSGTGGSGGTTPPPSAPEDYSRLEEVLGDLKYACRNRGFEICFADPAHQGLGHMNLGTRRGQNERGKYIEIGTKDCSPVDEAYFKPGSGNDGIIRIQEDADGRITATLVAYWCAEKNCVTYRGEPLFVSPSDPPDVRNPASIYYGWMGPGSSKQGMEVELVQPPPAPQQRAGGGEERLNVWGATEETLALVARMTSDYGMARDGGTYRTGQSKPVVMDFCRRVADPEQADFARQLGRSARHSGYLNVLFSDGSVRAAGPSELDPMLLGNSNLWNP